jgi:hypothetical protein
MNCIDCGKKLIGHNNPKRCNSCAKKGILNPMFGKKTWITGKTHNNKTKKILSIKGKGRTPWNKGTKGICKAWNKGGTSWSKGKHFSIEHREKIKQANLKIWASEQKRKEHGLKQKGKFVSLKTRIKQRKARKGIYCRERHPNWKGGLSPLHELIRHSDENKKWIKDVFIKDNYTCQDCGKAGSYLEAHHIKPFAEIFQEFLAQYSQFSLIEDKETLARLAITYEPFWDINNGETLCEDCHKVRTWGVKNNA